MALNLFRLFRLINFMYSVKFFSCYLRWRFASYLCPAAERHLRARWAATPPQGYGETVTHADPPTCLDKDSSCFSLEKKKKNQPGPSHVWGLTGLWQSQEPALFIELRWSPVTWSQTGPTLAARLSLKQCTSPIAKRRSDQCTSLQKKMFCLKSAPVLVSDTSFEICCPTCTS